MMKILFTNILVAVLSLGAYAQESGSADDNMGAQREDGGYESGWAMKVDGDVVVCEGGERKVLEEETRLPDGTRITPDGTIIKADGETIMLRDGQTYIDGDIERSDETIEMQQRYNKMSENYGIMEETQRQTYESITMLNRKMDLTNRKSDLIEEKITHTSRIVFCPNRVTKKDKAEASHRIEEINKELNAIDQELEMINKQMNERETSRNQ